MPLVLPYPNKPANGDAFDATVVQANFTAIAQAVQSFDGTQVQAGTIAASALVPSANPITRSMETQSNFVYSGLVVSTPSGLNISITGGTLYVNGNRITFAGVGSQTLLASKDYYIDVDYLGNVYYQNVANGANAPALTANSIRIAFVVTGAATVSSIKQTGFDSGQNKIYYTGSVAGQQAAGIWWEEIARFNLTVATNTFTLANIPYRRYLQMRLTLLATGGTIVAGIQMNGDGAANYNFRYYVSGTASVANGAAAWASLEPTSVIASGTVDIINIPTQKKVGYVNVISAPANASSNVLNAQFWAVWHNSTDPISSFSFTNAGTGTYAPGTEVIILGHN